jgi:hypothetical protein
MLDVISKLTAPIITLIVGSFAGYVAYLQFKINREKLRLDLFTRRLEAFEKVQEYFTLVMREGRVTDEALRLLSEARYRSRFLFGHEMEKYFDELWEKAFQMRGLYLRLYGPNSLPVGPERTSICEQESVLLKWKIAQLKSSHEKYARYMRFTQ